MKRQSKISPKEHREQVSRRLSVDLPSQNYYSLPALYLDRVLFLICRINRRPARDRLQLLHLPRNRFHRALLRLRNRLRLRAELRHRGHQLRPLLSRRHPRGRRLWKRFAVLVPVCSVVFFLVSAIFYFLNL